MHVISGACKAGVVDVQSEDGLLDTSSTGEKMNKDITWKKKSQKGAVALIHKKEHFKLQMFAYSPLLKIVFVYILNYLKILLMNMDNTEYMYGPMPGVGNEIKTRKPSDEDWEVVHMVVHTMKEVVVMVHKNELVGRQWLLSD